SVRRGLSRSSSRPTSPRPRPRASLSEKFRLSRHNCAGKNFILEDGCGAFGSRVMRGIAPKSAVCWVALCLGFVSGPAAAAVCSDVYPNALQGPPPDWQAWDFGSACYTRWRLSAAEEEQALAARCRETPGAKYLLFEQNKAT